MGKLSQREKRISLINILYRYFVIKASFNDIMQYTYDLQNELLISEEMIPDLEAILNNSQSLISLIESKLKQGWKFNRLDNYDKAILLYCGFEIVHKKIAKSIVINEAMEILKQYEINLHEHRYINSVLDQL